MYFNKGDTMDRKLNVLIVEDDPNVRNELKLQIEEQHESFNVIGVTDNSDKAVQIALNDCPDAVILDLELQYGGGDGFDFLKQVRSANLPVPPYILVTTNNISPITHKAAREMGADYIMTKVQKGYTAKRPIDFLKMVAPSILNRKSSDFANVEQLDTANEELRSKNRRRRIYKELNAVGVNPKSAGYGYLADAIEIIMSGVKQHVTNEVGKRYSKAETTIERAMQNAINRAWNTANTDDLLENYTARITSERGVPTITEFIFYYANKIETEY